MRVPVQQLATTETSSRRSTGTRASSRPARDSYCNVGYVVLALLGWRERRARPRAGRAARLSGRRVDEHRVPELRRAPQADSRRFHRSRGRVEQCLPSSSAGEQQPPHCCTTPFVQVRVGRRTSPLLASPSHGDHAIAVTLVRKMPLFAVAPPAKCLSCLSGSAPPDLVGGMYNRLESPPRLRRGQGWLIELSRRQKQVLALLASGLTDEETGVRLGISARTARAHVDALKRKLGVNRRRELPGAYRALTGKDPFEG